MIIDYIARVKRREATATRQVEALATELISISEKAAAALTELDISSREGAQSIRIFFQGFG